MSLKLSNRKFIGMTSVSKIFNSRRSIRQSMSKIVILKDGSHQKSITLAKLHSQNKLLRKRLSIKKRRLSPILTGENLRTKADGETITNLWVFCRTFGASRRSLWSKSWRQDLSGKNVPSSTYLSGWLLITLCWQSLIVARSFKFCRGMANCSGKSASTNSRSRVCAKSSTGLQNEWTKSRMAL